VAKINPNSFLDLIMGGKNTDVYADKHTFFEHLLDVTHIGTEEYFDFLTSEINKYVIRNKNVSEKELLREFKKSRLEPIMSYVPKSETSSTPTLTRLLFWPVLNADIHSKSYRHFNIDLDLLHRTFLPPPPLNPFDYEAPLLILIDFKFKRNKLSELICISPAGTTNIYDNKMNLKKIIFEDKSELVVDDK